MEYQNLLISSQEGIGLVTINRERALNALNTQTMQELHHFFSNEANTRDDMGYIITGAGEKAFVAGADIKEFQALDEHGGHRMAAYGHQVFSSIERLGKPVVAVVNGFALGGGCELAMACHLRIAEEHARFGQPEVNLGIIPGYGGTQRLIQYIGKTKAMELLLTADMIDAEQAEKLGLVNQVVPKGEGMDAATKLLKKIAQKGPIAIAKVIESVNAYFDYDVDGFRYEVNAFGQTTQTEDFQEGATAFVEKRRANFSGK